MADDELIARLAGLSGLDPPSVAEQLLPYLRSQTIDETAAHLASMLGPSAPVDSLVALVHPASNSTSISSRSQPTAQHFTPPARPTAAAPAAVGSGGSTAFPSLSPSVPSGDALLAASFQRHTAQRSFNAQKKPAPPKKPQAIGLAHLKKGQLPAARPQRTLPIAPDRAFNPGSGTVHSKSQELEELEAQYASSGHKKGKGKAKPLSTSTSTSTTSTPTTFTPAASPRPRAAVASVGSPTAHFPSPSLQQPVEPTSTNNFTLATPEAEPNSAVPESKFDVQELDRGFLPLPTVHRPRKPTTEFTEIEDALAVLRIPHPPSSIVHQRLCLCGGHIHSPAPWIPMCSSCQRVLCSALVPSPIAPGATCPSCGAPSLPPDDLDIGTSGYTARRSLYMDAVQRYERLAQELVETEEREERQRQVALQLQAEKQRAQAAQIAAQRGQPVAPHELDALFPSLATTPPVVQAASASEAVQQKTHRVMRLNTKTHKMVTQRFVRRSRPAPTSTPTTAASSNAVVGETTGTTSQDEFESEVEPEESPEATPTTILVPDPYDLGPANITRSPPAGTPTRTARRFAPPRRPTLPSPSDTDSNQSDSDPEVTYGERSEWRVPAWSSWAQAGIPIEVDSEADEEENWEVQDPEAYVPGAVHKKDLNPHVEPRFASSSSSSGEVSRAAGTSKGLDTKATTKTEGDSKGSNGTGNGGSVAGKGKGKAKTEPSGAQHKGSNGSSGQQVTGSSRKSKGKSGASDQRK